MSSLRRRYLGWDLQYDEKPVYGKKEGKGKKEKEREGNKWVQGKDGSHTLQAVINSMSKGLRWKQILRSWCAEGTENNVLYKPLKRVPHKSDSFPNSSSHMVYPIYTFYIIYIERGSSCLLDIFIWNCNRLLKPDVFKTQFYLPSNILLYINIWELHSLSSSWQKPWCLPDFLSPFISPIFNSLPGPTNSTSKTYSAHVYLSPLCLSDSYNGLFYIFPQPINSLQHSQIGLWKMQIQSSHSLA